MIGTSTAEYIFIRACILFLHHIAPFSVLYCAVIILGPRLWPAFHVLHSPYFIIEGWLLAEALFYVLVFLPHSYHLQRAAIHPEPLSREEREKLFRRCFSTISDPEKYIRGWFLGAKIEDIKRENMKEFLSWAFFNAELTEKIEGDEMEGYLRESETFLGREIPPGKSSAKSLRLTLDKVDFLHRSLFWYLCVFVVDTMTYCRLWYSGFHFHRSAILRFFTLFPFRPLVLLGPRTSPVKHLTYWHRPHTSKTQLPVLFIHGIGIGLYPYVDFLRELNKAGETDDSNGDVGIIALELMPVSFRITHAALEKDVMVREISDLVQHHGWTKFVLVSHSYGSVISTHLLKSPLTAPRIASVVLIDPVSFLLHLPDVAYNFTSRAPARANEHQLWYFASKDMGVAHTLGRRFFWSENICWKEDLGLADRDVTVVLSRQDLIVDTRAVRRYLTSSEEPESAHQTVNGVGKRGENGNGGVKNATGDLEVVTNDMWKGTGLEVLWFQELDHAQVFDSAKTRQPVVRAIRVYSAKG